MTTLEFRDHAIRRPEHPIQEEVEEIDFKQNIMKIMENLKQDMKSCLKETEKTKKGRKIE